MRRFFIDFFCVLALVGHRMSGVVDCTSHITIRVIWMFVQRAFNVQDYLDAIHLGTSADHYTSFEEHLADCRRSPKCCLRSPAAVLVATSRERKLGEVHAA